ncbi:MAG: UDP-glucose 4-epimerase GalE [Candidatus Woesearchaeota archaeon]
MATILVTGGAGYIGSGATQQLLKEGHTVVIIDNLSKGKKELVPEQARFYQGDLTDKKLVEEIFNSNEIDAVMHFAAYKAVGESMRDAMKYSDNITGSLVLLNAMVKHSVKKIIFSSTAAVYGEGSDEPITEATPVDPKSYYGTTKHMVEENIKWYGKIHGINHIILRYFNVAGDTGAGYVDPKAENIFPIITEVLSGKREELVVFGNDYNTHDGTGVRDYIDVNDLIDAHVKALDANESAVMNLGTERGYSVLDLVKTFEKVSGKNIPYRIGKRREGDPALVVASYEKAKEVIGWKPKRSIEETVTSTLETYSRSS